MKQRYLLPDISRSICVLWIVGVWHMLDYINHISYIEEIGAFITRGVLSCFTFLSGFFLGKKQIIPLSFYKSRLIRFWPLLILSAITLFVMRFGDGILPYLGTITGLSCFGMPWAVTLWYFAMLIFFYLITPLLLSNKTMILTGEGKNIVLIRSIIVFAALFLYSKFNNPTERLLPYYVFYILGLLSPFSIMEWTKSAIIQFGCLLMFVGSVYADLKYGGEVMHVVASFSLVGVIFILSSYFERIGSEKTNKFFTILSYSSMCAYLFHRQIYGVIAFVCKKTVGFVPLYIAPVMILILFIISFFIQHYYDKIINIIYTQYGSKS